jgi:hypothetical protein
VPERQQARRVPVRWHQERDTRISAEEAEPQFGEEGAAEPYTASRRYCQPCPYPGDTLGSGDIAGTNIGAHHGHQRRAKDNGDLQTGPISLGTPGSNSAPEATLERGAPRDNQAKTENSSMAL